MPVVEQEIQVKIFAVHRDTFLALHKGETDPQFQDEGLDFAEDRRFQILLRVGVLEAKEIEQVGSRNTRSGLSLSSSRSALSSSSASLAGLRERAVRSNSIEPILRWRVRVLHPSIRHISE